MEEEVISILNKLNITYEMVEHKAVYTVSEANDFVPFIEGIGCKNLFLKDNDKNYYIYVLNDNVMANFNELCKNLEVTKISFASEKELYNKLKLNRGSVTPLGIINNYEKDVTILLNKELIDKKILMHPNTNTKTISINFKDLIRIINYIGCSYRII